MPKTANERINDIVEKIEALFMQEKHLAAQQTRGAEVKRHIVLGQLDGYCEALEKEVQSVARELGQEQEALQVIYARLGMFEDIFLEERISFGAIDAFLRHKSNTYH